MRAAADEGVEVCVVCYRDFPNCMLPGAAYFRGIAVKQSECPCEVARKAVAHLLPQMTLKGDADV